jgi:hypothetical protein
VRFQLLCSLSMTCRILGVVQPLKRHCGDVHCCSLVLGSRDRVPFLLVYYNSVLDSTMPESCCFATTSRDQPLGHVHGRTFCELCGVWGDFFGVRPRLQPNLRRLQRPGWRAFGTCRCLVAAAEKFSSFAARTRQHEVKMGWCRAFTRACSAVHGVAVGSFSRSVAAYDDMGEAAAHTTIRVFCPGH